MSVPLWALLEFGWNHINIFYILLFSYCSPFRFLTLFVPAYFDVSGTGGGHIVPPLNIFGLGRVRVPILFGNYLPRSYLPYTKGFMKFGCPEPSKKVFDFRNFCSSKRRLTRFVRVPPYEILVFPTNFIFFQGNEITLRGKKCTALFQTHN